MEEGHVKYNGSGQTEARGGRGRANERGVTGNVAVARSGSGRIRRGDAGRCRGLQGVEGDQKGEREQPTGAS